jgi:hypothetical protein
MGNRCMLPILPPNHYIRQVAKGLLILLSHLIIAAALALKSISSI